MSDDSDSSGPLGFIIAIVLVIIGIVVWAQQDSACRAQGKILVRGFGFHYYECVRP